MTDTQQEKQPKNLIPKHNPLSQAILAGSAAGVTSLAGSLVFDVPADSAFKMATGVFLAGAGYSFWLSFQDGRNQTKPRKRNSRGRQIPFSHAQGSQKIDMEYSVSQGGYVARETWFNRLLFGKKPTRPIKPIEPIAKPEILSEFTFHSQGIQLLESEVKAFLQIAWTNRARGRGLSERFWVREISQRPGWFRSLGKSWYLAFLMLLARAENTTQKQLVVSVGHQQHALRYDSRQTLAILKWSEYNRRNK